MANFSKHCHHLKEQSKAEMRKQKLRSSMKAIQEAISSLKPMNHICVQSRTYSFRDEATIEGSGEVFSLSKISDRLFFSPSMTKSIMEEAKARASNEVKTMENRESMAGDLYSGTVVVFSSEDPYADFKASMVEMVEAHGVREWLQLEELLLCYLRLNEKRNHKAIMLAFVDLVESLMAHLRDEFPSSFQ